MTVAQIGAMPDTKDLLRAAIAFSVAGMDAYFTDRFAESLVRFLKKRGPTNDLTELLLKAGLDTKAALEMLTMKRPYRRVRTLVEVYLSKYTTQKQEVIDKLFSIYGVKDLCRHAQGLSKTKNLLASVTEAVLRRHAIVHGGDLNLYDRPRPIDPKLASRYIADIDRFVTHAETILVKALKM